MSFPYYAQVQRSHSELMASGQIQRRDNQEAVEHDKGLQTRRAGYYANQLDSTIGILEKTSGNNALGYSVDLLITRAGVFWDVATDSNGLAMPVDGETRGPDAELALKWRQPTAELAGLTDIPVPVPPGEVIPYDEAKSVEFGMACNEVYTESGAPIDPGMISVQSQRCAYDYYVMGEPWDACLEKHVNELRAIYGLPPV
jgi:hypothetical protein